MNLIWFFYIILIPLILGISHRSIRTLSIFRNFYSITCVGMGTVSDGRFAGRADSQTGLCPIPLSKSLLNRPGRFARRPDRRFGLTGRAFRPASKPFKTHTISDERSSLHIDTIEALECLKSWFRAGIFTQGDLSRTTWGGIIIPVC